MVLQLQVRGSPCLCLLASFEAYGGQAGALAVEVARVHWEWQKRAVDTLPWMKLPSKLEKLVSTMFNSSIVIKLGDGTSALF